MLIAPSILSADFRSLEQEVTRAVEAGADMIHCDIMDGHFVPNISFGPLVVAAVRRCTTVPLDVHLMISNPQDYIERFRESGADTITVHAEATDDLPGLIAQIRDSGARVGITVNPDKPVDLFLDYLSEIDQVLIMTVYAGFGGQKFMPEMMDKVQKVYRAAREIGHAPDIEVDGGVNAHTASTCAEHGANIFVAGSYIFGGENYAQRIGSVREGAQTGQAKAI
ncbi:MAG: ribulose-phosphate 3-epimerase [Chitinivibrionales bacterium]|nr:ribulose-phosphate 3-epimerase [Chitinivibrionales bacterium]MBD3357961.1 ribulose-phosphate 3-epimerase [Chitinivibrionales bacterium]